MAFSTSTSLLIKAQNSLGALVTPLPTTPVNITSQIAAPKPDTIAGSNALAKKNQSQYSNKQFIAPFSYQQNIEGTFINVDYLGKKILTNGAVPYRAIVSLSATPLSISQITDASSNNPNRLVKKAPSSAHASATNAAAQIYSTGINAVTNSFTGRTTQFSTSTQSSTTQLAGNVQSKGDGVLQNLQTTLPLSKINQTVSNLPGFNIATNALGQIPGGTNLTSALSNPVGAIGGLEQTFAKGLNLQGGLPGSPNSLGSLGSIFSTASDLANSGPPTSLTGLVSVGKQIQAIICNFKLPTLTIPSFSSITKAVGGAIKGEITSLSEIGKQIQKEFQDTLSNINNQLDILKQVNFTLPDLDTIYKSAIKELTSCNNSPNQKNNVVSGQPSAPPPPAPALAVATPITNTGTGFSNTGNTTPG